MDKPGPVLLGCHLHGSMRGHVHVTDSAWTLKTDADGLARFPNVPDGPARMRVWHVDQLIDLPQRTLQVLPAPVQDTVQLGVVPRRRRSWPGEAPWLGGAAVANGDPLGQGLRLCWPHPMQFPLPCP